MMTILRKSPLPGMAAELARVRDEQFTLRAEFAELRAERDALRAQLEGDIPAATYWLQSKVWRQRRALDDANQALTAHRFALRLLGRIREPVTAAEWRAARDALASEQHQDRTGDKVPG
jgi:hypothetical protein